MPALEAAAQISSLCKADIVELKSFKCPPGAVVLTMEVICVMLGVPPVRKRNGVVDYWESGKLLLADVTFLNKLLSLHSHLPVSRLDAVTPYMSREDFMPDLIRKSSLACAGLCTWVREIY